MKWHIFSSCCMMCLQQVKFKKTTCVPLTLDFKSSVGATEQPERRFLAGGKSFEVASDMKDGDVLDQSNHAV